MRKIEQQMIAAIRQMKNWHNGNTSVGVVGSEILVRLHGHQIARCLDGQWYWTFAGWPTATTASRLSALAYSFDWHVNPSRAKGGSMVRTTDHKRSAARPSDWYTSDGRLSVAFDNYTQGNQNA